MKHPALLPAIAAAALANAFAAPLYFTFTGAVTMVATDVGGYAAAHDIRAGTPVGYVFMVDTAAPGYSCGAGSCTDRTDIHNPGYDADYFFDSLITPSLFSPAVSDRVSGSWFAFRTASTLGSQVRRTLLFQVIIGTADHRTQVALSIPDSGKADWLPKAGTTGYVATESYVNGSTASSGVSVSLSLAAVSATRPSALFRVPAYRAAYRPRADFRGESVYFAHGAGDDSRVDIRGRGIPYRDARPH